MQDDQGLPVDGRAKQDEHGPRSRARRRPSWMPWALGAGVYGFGFLAAHALMGYLSDLTLIAYVGAHIGGLVFIAQYVRTDWRAHSWGRHVMAFMVCLEVLFTLVVSRRLFGVWPGLAEIGFLASITFAAIVWWRAYLQYAGLRAARRGPSDLDD